MCGRFGLLQHRVVREQPGRKQACVRGPVPTQGASNTCLKAQERKGCLLERHRIPDRQTRSCGRQSQTNRCHSINPAIQPSLTIIALYVVFVQPPAPPVLVDASMPRPLLCSCRVGGYVGRGHETQRCCFFASGTKPVSEVGEAASSHDFGFLCVTKRLPKVGVR